MLEQYCKNCNCIVHEAPCPHCGGDTIVVETES